VPKSHNKKRNVGIVYELLLRRVSECLINEDTKSAQKTLDIISRRFRKGSELYKEFRLFRALVKSSVSDTAIAAAILTEAKSAARRTNIKKLEKEKSDLIREMNYTLNDKKLYSRFIPDYKELATIQVLLNDWRDGDNADIERMAMYESKAISRLLEEKDEVDIDDQHDTNVDGLVVKIMSEKINKKYSKNFNIDQRDILKKYAFSCSTGNDKDLKDLNNRLSEIKERSIKSLKLLSKSTDNSVIKEKINFVREKIVSEKIENIDDKKIVKFLTLIDLHREIKESI
jgi:hypothetical protein